MLTVRRLTTKSTGSIRLAAERTSSSRNQTIVQTRRFTVLILLLFVIVIISVCLSALESCRNCRLGGRLITAQILAHNLASLPEITLLPQRFQSFSHNIKLWVALTVRATVFVRNCLISFFRILLAWRRLLSLLFVVFIGPLPTRTTTRTTNLWTTVNTKLLTIRKCDDCHDGPSYFAQNL